MRQMRWVEFSKDYDFELRYHSSKANVVDALSRKSLHLSYLMIQEMDLLKKFRDLNMNMTLLHGGILLNHLEITNDLREQIRQSQELDMSYWLRRNMIIFQGQQMRQFCFKTKLVYKGTRN